MTARFKPIYAHLWCTDSDKVYRVDHYTDSHLCVYLEMHGELVIVPVAALEIEGASL